MDESNPARRRYFDIDVLRFLAAFAVMLLHYVARGFADGDNYSPVFYGREAADLVKYNYLAVNLFFMISGFVILMSAESGSAWSFVRSRVLRLYPAYWFCCTLSFVLTYFFINHIFKLTVPRYVLNMTMLQGFFGIGNVDGVYWTLLVELKFYLLILAVLLVRGMGKIEFFLAGWLALSAVQVALANPLIEKLFITNYAPFFVAGSLFYRSAKLGFSWPRVVMLVATVPLGIHFELVDLVRRAAHFNKLTYHPEVVAGICLALYIVFLCVIIRPARSTGYARVAVALGALSYPIYLIHLNVGMVMFNLVGARIDKWLLLVAMLAGIVASAYLINKFVESPLAAFLKRKLPRPLESTNPATPKHVSL